MAVTLVNLGWKIAKIHHGIGPHSDRVELINPPTNADGACGLMWLQTKEAVQLAQEILKHFPQPFTPDATSAQPMTDAG
jgi:hypothetical protein